ncbi:MAG: PAS domain S-box protein [Pseudomonadota bacterium]
MQDQTTSFADLLTCAGDLTGPQRLDAQLGWVAAVCGASAVMLALRDAGGRVQPQVVWPRGAPMPEGLAPIALGPLDGARQAVLVVAAPPLSDAVLARLRGLGPALCLILENHIARTAADAARAQLTDDRLSAILAALPDLVFEITAEGRYADFLAGPSDLMGNAKLTLPGRLLEDVLPADIAAATRADLDLSLHTGRSPPARYQLGSPLGLRWYERSSARKAATGPDDVPTAIFVVRDVTDEVQRAEDLHRLGRIVETMSNMVVIVDADHRVSWANRAWETRTGHRLDAVRGRDLASLVRGADLDHESAARVTEVIARGESYHGATVNFDAEGKPYWIDFNILPLRDADGRISGYVSVETDITAQKQSEARAAHLADVAERARTRLYNAIETLPDGVIIWDEDDRMVVANSAYRRMYPEVADVLVEGVSQDTITRVGIELKLFPNAVGREEEWVAEERARFRNPRTDEVLRADGRWIRRLDLLTADGGRIAVRIDTTERHRQIDALDAANKSLAEARQSLAQIIESANVGTWDWLPDQNVQRIGGRYAQMLGYDPGDLGEDYDATFTNLVHPDDLARVAASEDEDFGQPPAGDEPVREHQLRFRRKDGSWAWIMSRSGVTERHPDGRHRRVVGIHLDVTERKLLADEVVTSRAFLTEVMDASISAIVVMDATGRITYANAEAERILGIGRSVIEGRLYNDPVWRVTHPDGTPMPDDALPFHRALTTGQTVRDLRMAIEWPDGARRILSVNAAPHAGTGAGPDPVLIITSFVDITDDLAKAVSLEQALQEAQASSRSKSTFLANMSHEIRTPLNGVLGMAELLDDMISEPGKKLMIGTIRQSGELLLNVLNEILDMSKIEAGKMVIEQISFVPAEIVRQVAPLHALRAEEKGLDLDVMTNVAAERALRGDPFRIQQILNNLLSNAIKFTERGSVVLSMSVRNETLLSIEVRDTGIGMTPEQVARIFDNFEQAETGTTRRFGGTGLGMTIVRSLVDLMKGEINVTSTPGSGTTVRLGLPLEVAPDLPAPDLPAPDAVAMRSLAGVRLLIADDSQTNRLVLCEMLKDSGATLVLATNGAEAVAEWTRLAAAGTPADLLLLDIAMPVLDGIGALAAIRATGGAGETVAALAITANAMAHQVAEYIIAGFDSHLPKPFRRTELFHAIHTLLRGA